MSDQTLAIVAPCYNEQEMLPTSVPALLSTLDRLIDAGKVNPASRLYFVDDGSRDNTWQQLVDASKAHPGRIVVLRLSRNKGHQSALMAGLEDTTEDMVVSIDADLQDDPVNIDKMVDAYHQGSDVVYGVRAARDTDTKFKRMTAEGYYHVMRKLGVDLVFNHADFRLMSRRALNALLEYPESQLFLRGMVREVGFESSVVEYHRPRRAAGGSKYRRRRLLSLACYGIATPSTAQLRAITLLSIAASAHSRYMLLRVRTTRVFTAIVVPGWTSMQRPQLFICCGQL